MVGTTPIKIDRLTVEVKAPTDAVTSKARTRPESHKRSGDACRMTGYVAIQAAGLIRLRHISSVPVTDVQQRLEVSKVTRTLHGLGTQGRTAP